MWHVCKILHSNSQVDFCTLASLISLSAPPPHTHTNTPPTHSLLLGVLVRGFLRLPLMSKAFGACDICFKVL